MKYYVVSDVHGYYTTLMRTLREAGFFDERGEHKLVLCGDLLDRGSEANQMVDFMLELRERNRLIYIRGNHEDLMEDCLRDLSRGGAFDIASGRSHHYHNMTWDTVLQLSGLCETEAYNRPIEAVCRVKQSRFYKKLLPTCIDYYETPNYIFTHGWIPCRIDGYRPNLRYSYDPNWRDAGEEAWRRARWLCGIDLACRHKVLERGKTIVCGHWNASYGHANIEHRGSERGHDADHSPFSANGILAIDAHTALSARMNCVVISD